MSMDNQDTSSNIYHNPHIVRELGPHPLTGVTIILKRTKPHPRITPKYPFYVQLGYGTLSKKRQKQTAPPKFCSIPNYLDPDTITVDEAAELFKLPRLIGQTPTGGTLKAFFTSGGPRVLREETEDGITWQSMASLPSDRSVLTVTVEEVLAIKRWRLCDPLPPKPEPRKKKRKMSTETKALLKADMPEHERLPPGQLVFISSIRNQYSISYGPGMVIEDKRVHRGHRSISVSFLDFQDQPRVEQFERRDLHLEFPAWSDWHERQAKRNENV